LISVGYLRYVSYKTSFRLHFRYAFAPFARRAVTGRVSLSARAARVSAGWCRVGRSLEIGLLLESRSRSVTSVTSVHHFISVTFPLRVVPYGIAYRSLSLARRVCVVGRRCRATSRGHATRGRGRALSARCGSPWCWVARARDTSCVRFRRLDESCGGGSRSGWAVGAVVRSARAGVGWLCARDTNCVRIRRLIESYGGGSR
jgi:hypothetical protein